MITIFNRRELITLADNGRYMNVKQCLTGARIPYYTKFVSGGGMATRGRGGAYHQPIYKIYVHRDDYDRAVQAMQPALRGS